MTNSKLVPRRRFKEFESDGEWEQKILSELAEVEGGGTPSTVNPQYWDGDIDWYTPAEIGESVFVGQSKRKMTVMGLVKSSAKVLPIGTVLFTSRAGIGKTAILAREGCTNQGFQSIVPKEDLLASYFVYSQSNKLKQYGERIGSGSTFVEVSGKQMSEMPLIIPSIFEQKELGDFFQTIDSLISNHQHKLDKLKDLKKAYLTEMFPAEGERVPKRRFPGFESEWEQKKLTDLLSLLKDGTHGTHQDVNKGPLLLSAKNIKGGDIIWDETDRRISLEEYMKIHSKFVLNSGDILLTIVGSIGEAAVLEDASNITFQRSVAFLRPNKTVSTQFLYTKIQTKEFQKELDNRKSTSAQPGIYLGDLESIPISFTPLKKEQNKIGKFFEALDQLVTLQQQKLDKLNDLKKAYLNELFV